MSTHEHGNDDCVDYIERIVYLIDNELDQADCAEIQHHLEECQPCLEKYRLESTVKALVQRSCTEHAPAQLRERVFASETAASCRAAALAALPRRGRVA